MTTLGNIVSQVSKKTAGNSILALEQGNELPCSGDLADKANVVEQLLQPQRYLDINESYDGLEQRLVLQSVICFALLTLLRFKGSLSLEQLRGHRIRGTEASVCALPLLC